MKPAGWTWKRYLRSVVGTRLSRLGERIGNDWLIYNPIHFFHFHEMALEDGPGISAAMAEAFPSAKRWIDVGAGSGAYAAALQRLGKDVTACEHNRRGRKLAATQGVNCKEFDLSKTPSAQIAPPYDVAYCFEVAEHLPPVLGERLIDIMCECAPIIVFTAARPGQGGTGHIHEQPKEFWRERFASRNFRSDPDAENDLLERFRRHQITASWFHQNLIIARKS